MIEVAFDELDRLAPGLRLLFGLGARLVVGALLVGLGLLFLGERFGALRWAAVALTAAGMIGIRYA